jgi:GxxExxY protein
MNENELSEKIIGLAIKVHSALGPGLLESAYEKALVFELGRNGYKAEVQKSISINYEGMIIDEGYRADIIVNDLLILELKSVKQIEDIHLKQLLTYIRLSNKKLGLLINFNEILLKNGIRRVINGTI